MKDSKTVGQTSPLAASKNKLINLSRRAYFNKLTSSTSEGIS